MDRSRISPNPLSLHSSPLEFARAGYKTTIQQIPNLLKIVAPLLFISSLLLVVALSLYWGVAGGSGKESGLRLELVGLGILGMLALCLISSFLFFVLLRFAAQDPLPVNQSVRSLWRFESSFFSFMGLSVFQGLVGILVNLVGLITILALKPLLSSLPPTAADFLTAIPFLYISALWAAFLVVSSLTFFHAKQARVMTAMREGFSEIFGRFSFWGKLATLGFAGELLLQIFSRGAAFVPGTSSSTSGIIVGLISIFAIYIPLLFAYRAAYQVSKAVARN